MKIIDNFNFKGLKAIVRVDFNVPLDKATREVTDDTRIRGALKTIRKITADGGSAILMSHLGRPEGVMEKYSLKPVLPVLEKHLGMKVAFAPEPLARGCGEAAALRPARSDVLEMSVLSQEEATRTPRRPPLMKKSCCKAASEVNRRRWLELSTYATIYVTTHSARLTGLTPPPR